MKSLFQFLLIATLIIFSINSCDEINKPDISNELKLILSADRISGTAPLTVNYSARITGDTTGLKGFVPDYIFYSGGRTIIRYILPDTLQEIKTWAVQKTYDIAGSYKVVLLYQGSKNNSPFDLWSDTLTIKVN